MKEQCPCCKAEIEIIDRYEPGGVENNSLDFPCINCLSNEESSDEFPCRFCVALHSES